MSVNHLIDKELTLIRQSLQQANRLKVLELEIQLSLPSVERSTKTLREIEASMEKTARFGRMLDPKEER